MDVWKGLTILLGIALTTLLVYQLATEDGKPSLLLTVQKHGTNTCIFGPPIEVCFGAFNQSFTHEIKKMADDGPNNQIKALIISQQKMKDCVSNIFGSNSREARNVVFMQRYGGSPLNCSLELEKYIWTLVNPFNFCPTCGEHLSNRTVELIKVDEGSEDLSFVDQEKGTLRQSKGN